ncbi:MAG TPA: Crp/Fnr family transcriptional regulator [Candidatus Saccharimonadales bacterium]
MESARFIRQYPVRSFSKGEVLFSEGDSPTSLLALRRGFVKVTSLDDDGNERLIWIAGRYDLAPTEQLFTSVPLNFFYTALSDGEAYEVNKQEFITTAKADLSFLADVASTMGHHYSDLLERIDTMGKSTIRAKLIATLRYLAKRFGTGEDIDLYGIGLELTQQDFAEMIGSTRETTSVELHKLREEGFINYGRSHFVILNKEL